MTIKITVNLNHLMKNQIKSKERRNGRKRNEGAISDDEPASSAESSSDSDVSITSGKNRSRPGSGQVLDRLHIDNKYPNQSYIKDWDIMIMQI